jgi:hypothetical protein
MRILLIRILSVTLLVTGMVYGQSDKVSVTVESVNDIQPIQVAGVKHDREIHFVMSNSSKDDIAVFGRQIGNYFDPTGLSWKADPATGQVQYFDSNKKPILTRGRLEFFSEKLVKSGEQLRFSIITSTYTSCLLTFRQILWIRFGKSKKVYDVLSDTLPTCRVSE